VVQVALADLTTTSRTHIFPLASAPHHNKANMLFFDGSVRLASPTTDLAKWMILAPGHLNDPAALGYTTNPNDVWHFGRQLPF
jgi:prepilin-type processing-associated H-X9-DG protein